MGRDETEIDALKISNDANNCFNLKVILECLSHIDWHGWSVGMRPVANESEPDLQGDHATRCSYGPACVERSSRDHKIRWILQQMLTNLVISAVLLSCVLEVCSRKMVPVSNGAPHVDLQRRTKTLEMAVEESARRIWSDQKQNVAPLATLEGPEIQALLGEIGNWLAIEPIVKTATKSLLANHVRR